MKIFLLSFVMLTFAAFSASACELVSDSTHPLRDCPPDVMQHMEREAACAHWGGEEPYDDARREMILKALDELRCDEPLFCSRHMLLEKYRGTAESSVIAAGLRIIAGEDWADDPFYLKVAAGCGADAREEEE